MKDSNKSQLRRLAVVLNDSNDAITVQDLKGNILAWNKGAKRLYGYSEDEALKMNVYNLVPDNQKEEALSYLKKISNGEIIESFETMRLTKDGTLKYIWLILTCLKNDKGQIDSVASTERDITSTKKEIMQLRGLLPMCSSCKSIRNDKGYWQELESYLHRISDVIFSHGLCPECAEKLYGDQEWFKKTNTYKSQQQRFNT